MKILFIGCSSCWHTAEWMNYFADKHTVYLFSDKKDYLPAQNHSKNIEIIHSLGFFGRVLNRVIIFSHILRRLNKMLSLPIFKYRIKKILKEKEIDIIHAHSLYYGYLASFIGDKLPIIFTPMGSDIIVHAHKNNYYRKMAKAAFAASEVITGDSALLKQRGLEIGAPEENNFIIQNGVDAKRFYPFYTHLKKEYGMKEEDLLIFSPRALDENYNIDIIIDALGILKRTIGNFKCIFAYAFGGEYFNMLNTKVSQLGLESNVIWLGFTEYNDMPIYYNAADIVVSIPSSDSSPKSVYEAMFCSTPVILSDIGWVYEKLDAYDFVEKVPPRCSDSLATALLDLYHRPERRHEMQDAGLVVAAKYFEYQDNMQKMERIMEATLCAMKE